jgi:hypothetical protein
MVAALHGVLDIADVLVHLHLQPGLGYLLGQPRQQPARADHTDTFSTRLLHELLGDRPLGPTRTLVC